MSLFNPVKKSELSFNQKMVRLVIVWVLVASTLFIILPKLRTTIINLQSPEVLLQPSCNLSKLSENDTVMWKGKPTTITDITHWDYSNRIDIELAD